MRKARTVPLRYALSDNGSDIPRAAVSRSQARQREGRSMTKLTCELNSAPPPVLVSWAATMCRQPWPCDCCVRRLDEEETGRKPKSPG
jgi:hypothetical protein